MNKKLKLKCITTTIFLLIAISFALFDLNCFESIFIFSLQMLPFRFQEFFFLHSRAPIHITFSEKCHFSRRTIARNMCHVFNETNIRCMRLISVSKQQYWPARMWKRRRKISKKFAIVAVLCIVMMHVCCWIGKKKRLVHMKTVERTRHSAHKNLNKTKR